MCRYQLRPSPLLPFHHPRCLLLFLANPSSSYNPFAFESKRTWGMRKKKTFSPIFRFRLWQWNKDLNSFCNNEVNFCVVPYWLLWRPFLSVPSSWIFKFIFLLIYCCPPRLISLHVYWTSWWNTLVLLFHIRVVWISNLSPNTDYPYWFVMHKDKCWEIDYIKIGHHPFFPVYLTYVTTLL